MGLDPGVGQRSDWKREFSGDGARALGSAYLGCHGSQAAHWFGSKVPGATQPLVPDCPPRPSYNKWSAVSFSGRGGTQQLRF